MSRSVRPLSYVNRSGFCSRVLPFCAVRSLDREELTPSSYVRAQCSAYAIFAGVDMHAPSHRKVRVGIVGVGNWASSLVQGLTFYRDAQANEPVPGLMNVNLGGYHIRDVELSAAFDVHADKVGRDIADAIWAKPNNTHCFAEVAPTGVKVMRGPVFDGIGHYLRDDIAISQDSEVDVTAALIESRTDVVVSYLPVG